MSHLKHTPPPLHPGHAICKWAGKTVFFFCGFIYKSFVLFEIRKVRHAKIKNVDQSALCLLTIENDFALAFDARNIVDK